VRHLRAANGVEIARLFEPLTNRGHTEGLARQSEHRDGRGDQRTNARHRHQPSGHGTLLGPTGDLGIKAAAIACTLIETAKLNAVDPNAWLADTLARIPDHKTTKLGNLLP